MSGPLQIDPNELEWQLFGEAPSPGAPPAPIRFKSVCDGSDGAPRIQQIAYTPGHTSELHHHDIGELFVVLEGSLSFGDGESGPGSLVYIPAGTDYATVAGDAGAVFFRMAWEPE
jgi:quercetin dioxygenase-like cupin family protein